MNALLNQTEFDARSRNRRVHQEHTLQTGDRPIRLAGSFGCQRILIFTKQLDPVFRIGEGPQTRRSTAQISQALQFGQRLGRCRRDDGSSSPSAKGRTFWLCSEAILGFSGTMLRVWAGSVRLDRVLPGSLNEAVVPGGPRHQRRAMKMAVGIDRLRVGAEVELPVVADRG